MVVNRIADWRRAVEALFPERHLYVRSGGELKAFVLTTARQLTLAGVVAGAALWMGVCTASMMVSLLSASATDEALARANARSERWIADRQARLNNAIQQLADTNGSVEQIAQTVEKRHEALALMLTDFKDIPGAATALAAGMPQPNLSADATDRIRAVQMDQERLIAQAETFAKTRAERLKVALRLAGLNPASYARGDESSLGGPLIDARDPRALAAILDVDEDFARRIQRASNDMSSLRAMNAAVGKLPLATPTASGARSSGFGVRFDPFTRLPAYHSGQDFSGAARTPILATGPGVVSFTGVRSGYGNVVEIDHGGGFKTRYAHLSSILVRPGERVAIGARIGGMGSTGRSTGPHLHYEVWVNGRAQNPDRFLKAGQYVQQN
jgi:murein DD-endopeptidase MepM/ murein hydrolase activator NlpD